MSRRAKRVWASLFGLGVGVLFAFQDDWVYRDIPLPWVGYLIMAFGALGLMGVNVFIWGPLDKCNDEA